MKNNTKYSRVIAGTMTWGSWGKKLSTQEMVKLMNYCFSIDITSFDHADIYGDYGNEGQFGKAFAESGISREGIQLISKCGIQMTSGRANSVKHYQYDAEYIVWSCEQSLQKLRTEYLDLFLLHRPSPLMQPDEIAKAIEKLKDQGKIKEFGVSNFTPSQIALVESAVPVEANQVEFSLTHVEPMLDGTFDDCAVNNRMTMAWSPLGNYFRGDDVTSVRLGEVFNNLKSKYNCDESQLLLAFLLKHPAEVYPVVGTAQEHRLKAALDAALLELELQDWFLMLEASQGQEVP